MIRQQNKFNIPAFTGSMKNASLFALCLLVMAALFSSCKADENDIGADLIPSEDQLNVLTYETYVDALTVREDSIPTFVKGSGLSALLLGSYKDPIFGKVTSSFAAEFSPANVDFDFGAGYTVDSVVLSLEYVSLSSSPYYGDISKLKGAQRFKVYRLTEDITSDTVAIYYSNHIVGYDNNQLLGDKVVIPDVERSVKYKEDSTTITENPQLRIRLNSAAEALFAPGVDKSNWANATNFYNYFKGLYVMPDNGNFQQAGDGAVLRFDAASLVANNGKCRMRVYYHNNASTQTNPFDYYDFQVKSTTRKLNVYQHNYKGTQLLVDMNTGGILSDRTYVQAMGGVKTKVLLPDFSTIPEFSDTTATYVVNLAELLIPVDQSSISPTYPRPGGIVVLAPSLDTTYANLVNPPNAGIRDLSEVSATYYGGGYNATTGDYKFGLSLHISDLLNRKIANKGLYIVTESSATRADRLVILNTPAKKIKLKIIYTKI